MSPMRNIAPLMIRQVAAAARRTASVGGVVALGGSEAAAYARQKPARIPAAPMMT